MQSVNWCFTLNNYTDDDVRALKLVKCRYICLGFEIGEEKKTPHIQGFIQFETKVRLTAWKKINKKIHAEIMKGNTDQAIAYCKKGGVYEEKGDVIKERQRTDLREAKKKCAAEGIRAITGENDEYNSQVIRSCEIMLKYHEKVRDFKPEVVWVYGNSGSGKTKYVKEKCAAEDTYWKDSTKWWDGYDRHETVVMDDFRASNMKMNELLKLIDRYPHRVECKGSFRQMLSKKMYITSIMHPKEVYNLPEEPVQQLLRRIDRIVKVSKM